MSWKHIASPYLDQGVPIVDALVHRARTSGVETVVVAGEPILRDGRFTRIDRQAVLEELGASLQAPLSMLESRRLELSKELLPHVAAFYRTEGYLHEDEGEPFYRFNSRTTRP
jgi:hypothetical protein